MASSKPTNRSKQSDKARAVALSEREDEPQGKAGLRALEKLSGDEAEAALIEEREARAAARARRAARAAARREAENPKTPASVIKLTEVTAKPVAKARPRRRHWMLGASFLLMVVLPAVLALTYLMTRAEDRYASTAAFSVHKEDTAGAADMLTGMTALGVPGFQAPDAEILHQYIQSQAMVEKVDARLGLRALYGPAHEQDPIFALKPGATLEELVKYWARVVSLIFEPDTGLITLEVKAFSPEDAQSVASAVLDESAALIDELSRIAREDTIRLARTELEEAGERLKAARLEVARFRDIEQIVDPTADLAGQMGVISALQQSLAEAMIRRDMLIGTTTAEDDPRILQADRMIEAIEQRISEERVKVGDRELEGGTNDLARVVGDYESLLVDRQFAEQAHLAALTAYDQALAEARRKSRYLAVHIKPTLAETAIYPQRGLLMILITSFLVMGWALFILIAYSIRDRR